MKIDKNDISIQFRESLLRYLSNKNLKTQKTLSIESGISSAYISQIKKGERNPSHEIRVAIANSYGMSVDEFIGIKPAEPKHDSILNVIVNSQSEKEALNGMADDYRGIPLYESVRLAAGSKGMAFDPNEEPSSIVVVYKPELQGCSKHNLAAIKVGGDSMEPSIPIGSIVVVDLSDKEFAKGKVFVVNTPEAGLDIASIKRVQMWEKGFALISDNWKYPPELSPLDWDQLCVGRVVWMWKNIRNI